MTSTTAVSLRRTDLPRLSVSVKAAVTVLAIVAIVAVFAFGSGNSIAATWTSDLAAGLPGLALQWALIPIAAYWIESLITKR
ncbi:hypothetical protein ACJ41I_00865 [Bifidobacterium catenulatum]|uniref:hypothetical protein n=1 Tax=Bifidobacterium catenulatum TaxID=1686 RepID=UPI003D3276B7